jgi:hypothetical protein
MKSQRLTNNLIFSIRSRATQAKFGEERAAREREEAALADVVFEFFYPAEVQEAMAKIPDYLKYERNRISVYTGGQSNRRVCLRFSVPKRMWKSEFMGAPGNPAVPEGLESKLVAFANKESELERRASKFSSELHDVLKGISTTGKLLEMMPEAAAWVPTASGCSDIPVADKVAQFRSKL